MTAFPSFSSEFLRQVCLSLEKRRKALKHKSRQLECFKVYDAVDGKKLEKLEFLIAENKTSTGLKVQLHVWPDRWFWVDGRSGGRSGWDWEFNDQGRLNGLANARDLAESLEKFYSIGLENEPKSMGTEGKKIWSELISAGPVDVNLQH